jgi:DNA polymerase III delta subunit
MIILLYGEDTYRSRERLRILRDAFRERHDPTGVSTLRIDGEVLTAEKLITHLTVQGFLTKKRFVAVEGFFSHGAPQELAAAHEYLKARKFATDNILVFWEGGEAPSRGGASAASHALWADLVSIAKAEQYPPLEGAALTAWYTNEVRTRGGTIGKTDLQHLIHVLGNDLWRASTEIEKLVHACAGRSMTEADIDQLIAAPFDDNIFQLTDAIGQRDTGTALRLLENQFQNGAEALYLLRMLAWHVRNLIRVRAFLESGVTNHRTIARELRIHPFVAQKALRQSQLFSLDDLRKIHGGLLEIDRTMKSRSVDPRVLFTLLTVSSAPPLPGRGDLGVTPSSSSYSPDPQDAISFGQRRSA